MRIALLAATLVAAATAAFGQTPPVERTLTPSIVRVGKWAGGIAFDGRSLWVAESGQRSIAEIAPNGSIVRHADVGRLPVGMTALPDGRIQALIETDHVVWQHKPGEAKGRTLKWLPDYPQSMTTDGKALWVLAWPGDNSGSSRVYRVDATTGAEKATADLGEWGQTIAAAHGKVWVGHVRRQRLSEIDPQTLAAKALKIDRASIWALAANGTALFAGGRVDDDNQQGLLVSIDPASGQETKRIVVGQRVAQLAADDDAVVAIDQDGVIRILSPQDLTLRSTIRLSVGKYNPRSMLLLGDKLVVVAQQYEGENGAVFTLTGWR